jgi:hypothetical protein
MILPVALLAFAAAAFAQPVPLPNLPDGFRVGPGTGIIIDVFMDLLCPDCQGDWPTIKALVAHYGNNITVALHTFPLPYHTFAFRAAQGAHAIAALNSTPGPAVFDFATLIFANQDDFYGADLNTTWVDNHIAELATQLGYSKSDVAAGLADDNVNEATRISWKYGTSRYTTGTPHCACSAPAAPCPLHSSLCPQPPALTTLPPAPPTPPCPLPCAQTWSMGCPWTTSWAMGSCLTGRRCWTPSWPAQPPCRARAWRASRVPPRRSSKPPRSLPD